MVEEKQEGIKYTPPPPPGKIGSMLNNIDELDFKGQKISSVSMLSVSLRIATEGGCGAIFGGTLYVFQYDSGEY